MKGHFVANFLVGTLIKSLPIVWCIYAERNDSIEIKLNSTHPVRAIDINRSHRLLKRKGFQSLIFNIFQWCEVLYAKDWNKSCSI